MPSTRAELEAFAKTGQLPLDPTVRIKLIEGYGKMQGLIEDYRKTKDVGMLKYRIAQLENSQRMLTANQRASNALLETKGKSARAAADALQARLTGLDNNMTQIATRTQQFSSRVFNPVQAAYDASAKNEEAKYSALIQLTREMGNQGVSYDSGAPEIAALGQQFLTMTGEGSLADLNTPAARAAASIRMGASPAQQEDARKFLDKAYAAFDQERVARDSIKKGKSEADRLVGIAMATNQPVSQDLADQIAKLNSDLDTTFANYAKQSLPEVQQQLQAAIAEDSEYQRLLSEADWYKSEYERLDPAMRKSKEVSLGRIVAQPIFQEWAKSNGLAIGTALVNADGTVTYAPGKDDFKALMRFQYQMQNPDRFGERLFFDRGGSTGTVVEVTYTDPAERERQLARLAYDNGNLVGIESDGKMRYLTKQQYEGANENNGAEPTGYQSAVGSDGNAYLKDPYGNVYQAGADEEGNFKTTLVTSPPPGLQFSDAVITAGGKPARYMTAADFGSSSTKLDSIDDTSTPGVSAELAKVSPFKRVPPDQAREIGSVTTIGTLDKMHANTIIKNGVGALSINGGQQVITPDMKPYVREIVHKDGAKLSDVGGVVRQVRAEQLAATYGANDPRSLAEQRAIADTYYGQAPAQSGVTTAPLGTAAATTAAGARAGGQIPEPSGLLQSALAGPNPEAQVNQLERSGLVPSGTSTAVAESLAQAPATAPAAPSAAVTPAPAPAPVAAGAAAAAPAAYLRSKDGYIFKVTGPAQGRTLEVVAGPKGSSIPSNPVFKPGDPRMGQLMKNLSGAELVDYDPTKGIVTPKAPAAAAPSTPAATAPTVPAPTPAPAAPAPAAPPAPSKVEGRGPGVELEGRRGVLTEPTARTRPTRASAIVGGLGGALREDAAGTEEPSLIEALKARREAKREEERAKMRGEARAEADRQAERFQRAYDQSPRGRAEAAKSAADAISQAVAAGAMTADEATAARTKLGLTAQPTPTAAPAPAPKPTSPVAPPAAPAKPTEPIEKPDLSAFLPRKSMAEQVAPQGIGLRTQEPAAPVRPSMQSTAVRADKLGVVRAPSGGKMPAPEGQKPEPSMAEQVAGEGIGTVTGGQPSKPQPFQRPARAPEQAASLETETSGAARPEALGEKAEGALPATHRTKTYGDLDRGVPLSTYRAAVSKPEAKPRPVPQFRPMRPVNGTPEEMRQYTIDSRAYAASQK